VCGIRAIQRDRSKQALRPPSEDMENLVEQIVSPITYAQIGSYQAMGLRHRILTLPVMMAFVLSLIWRQVGSVTDAIRELNQRGILWAKPTMVTQQAVSERLRSFPPELFRKVLLEILPQMQQRWAERKRPLSQVMQWAMTKFSKVLILDGSTLDALLRKVGLLREGEGTVLAGRMATLLNAASLLPEEVWYEEDSHAHDQIVWLGSPQKRCQHRMRLAEVEHQGRWYRCLTNVLDPLELPAVYVAQLYQQRWRIEDAFNVAKRQLGLAYFWVGSINGVQVQVWATWILYMVLVDLTDRIADALNRPFEDISMEMVFKRLYHFTEEKKLGRASDPVSFLAQQAKFFGILKRKNHPPKSLTPILNS
jgi:hypothetical protein